MKLTKQQFLDRCANAFDAGLISESTLGLLDRWTDFVMRFEGGQMNYAIDFLRDEYDRLEHFHPHKTLANDADGYRVIQFAAILKHHCQQCATNPNAWWTRGCFCDHKKQSEG
jgi:hypothetical protein